MHGSLPHGMDAQDMRNMGGLKKYMPITFITFAIGWLCIAAVPPLSGFWAKGDVLDNTFAGVHQHGQFEIDIYLHSLTKFVSGHGDVMGGAAIAEASLIRSLRTDFTLSVGS